MCPDPIGPANGGVTFTGNSVGDTVTYACDTGFELIGIAVTTCTQAIDGNTASFESAAPTCRRKYALFSCQCTQVYILSLKYSEVFVILKLVCFYGLYTAFYNYIHGKCSITVR